MGRLVTQHRICHLLYAALHSSHASWPGRGRAAQEGLARRGSCQARGVNPAKPEPECEACAWRQAAGEQPRRGWRGAATARRAASLPLRDMRPPPPPRGASPDGWSSEGSRGGSPPPDGACGGTWDAWDAAAAPRTRRRDRGACCYIHS